MNRDQWQLVNQFFHDALDHEPATRSVFLDSACQGSPELRAELEELLAGDNIQGGFLEQRVIDIKLATRAIGNRLGPYEILGAIGAGGMGKVYRGRDTRLKRTVAIKVLSGSFSSDPGARKRLEREAQAIARLNHPNICVLYDIGHEGDLDYLVMEYLDGETLDSRLGKGPLQVEEFFRYAVEIANALDAAHGNEIIHRDLKPGNIVLTKAGAKVLDFGLAQSCRDSRSLHASISSNVSSMGEGMVVGTLPYMSPEQALGETLDPRTDLFSFGSVLYQMATGRQAFAGATQAVIIDALLNRIPTPSREILSLPGLKPFLAAELHAIITRALEKDRRLRYQTASDICADLSSLKWGTHKKRADWIRSRHLPWTVAAIVLLIATAAAWLIINQTGSADAELVPMPLTSYPGYESNPTFSPDGNQVAFAWSRIDPDHFNIYAKVLGSNQAVQLTTGPDSECPAWSPDGRSIAFVRELSQTHDGVFLISALGGPERKIADVDPAGDCIAWHPNGKWLLVSDRPSPDQPLGLFSLSLATGEKQRLTLPPSGNSDRAPAVSPNGEALIFTRGSYSRRQSNLHLPQISTSLTPRGAPTQVTFRPGINTAPAWTPDGGGIIFSSMGAPHNSSLYELRFSSLGWRPGKPKRLVFATEGARSPAVSRQGRLAYELATYKAKAYGDWTWVLMASRLSHQQS
jgi:eukaryotic-like serine/threonine-protein kinase